MYIAQMTQITKIFSRMESFQKISTLDPATMFLPPHLIIWAFCTHCRLPSPPPPLPEACRLKQPVHITTFVESSVCLGLCCSGRLLRKREKGFWLPPPDTLGHPQGMVRFCLPQNQCLKLLLHFEKQMSLGNVNFGQLHSFTLYRSEKKSPGKAGKEHLTHCL